MLKISAVSYSNSLPFVYGIEQSGYIQDFELLLKPPTQCTLDYVDEMASVALLPVGSLPLLKSYELFSSYCIGAKREVTSVFLLSNDPIYELHKVYLDVESATSVALSRILAKHFWHIAPQWEHADLLSMSAIKKGEGVVIIGDKAIRAASSYKYTNDLAHAWYEFTGLPFVFAVWVCNESVPIEIKSNLEQAFAYGIQNIPAVVEAYKKNYPDNFTMLNYLTRCIDYHFDDLKKKSMNLFLEYLNKEK